MKNEGTKPEREARADERIGDERNGRTESVDAVPPAAPQPATDEYLRQMLKAARCPNLNCDNSGTVCASEIHAVQRVIATNGWRASPDMAVAIVFAVKRAAPQAAAK